MAALLTSLMEQKITACVKLLKKKKKEEESSDYKEVLGVSKQIYFPSSIFLFMYSQEYKKICLIKSKGILSMSIK